MGTYTDRDGIEWTREQDRHHADQSYLTFGPNEETMRVLRAGPGWAATVNVTIVALGTETRSEAMAAAVMAVSR